MSLHYMTDDLMRRLGCGRGEHHFLLLEHPFVAGVFVLVLDGKVVTTWEWN